MGLTAAPGMTIRQKEPKNMESPLGEIDSFLTPTELFYIRSHFAAPQIDVSDYQLRIDGAVKHLLSLSYQELRDMPAVTQVAALECAGNGRVFLVPQENGAQWELGAVGNAEWTGVPLSALLERAGLAEGVSEIVLEGSDRGKPKEKPMPPGEISYARSVPVNKALRQETLVAYQMNGRDLPTDHGYPLRAVVPGHYGMASVKWLTRIRAVKEPFTGYWQTSDYAYWDQVDDQPVRRALGEMQIKSQIFRPVVYQTLGPGIPFTVEGAAWTGEAEVTEVEVSADSGVTWAKAELFDASQRYAWRRWRHTWLTPTVPGQYTLLSRGRDSSGRVQPDKHDPSYGSYVINHPLPIEVFVR